MRVGEKTLVLKGVKALKPCVVVEAQLGRGPIGGS